MLIWSATVVMARVGDSRERRSSIFASLPISTRKVPFCTASTMMRPASCAEVIFGALPPAKAGTSTPEFSVMLVQVLVGCLTQVTLVVTLPQIQADLKQQELG